MRTGIERIQNRIFLALVISLLLHFVLGLWISNWPELNNFSRNAVSIDVIDDEKASLVKDERQVVEQDGLSEKKGIDEYARYLSKSNQKVDEETRASSVGKFHNAKETVITLQLFSHARKALLQDKRRTQNLPKLADLIPGFMPGREASAVEKPGSTGQGISQTDDYLKDVKIGSQTLLNTREFVYYSYYSRMKERMRIMWEPLIREKALRLLVSGRGIASQEDKITSLLIKLDKDGKLVAIIVLRESGYADLDAAAIEATQAATPFSGPPQGLVEKDGLIKLKWDFVVQPQNMLVSYSSIGSSAFSSDFLR